MAPLPITPFRPLGVEFSTAPIDNALLRLRQDAQQQVQNAMAMESMGMRRAEEARTAEMFPLQKQKVDLELQAFKDQKERDKQFAAALVNRGRGPKGSAIPGAPPATSSAPDDDFWGEGGVGRKKAQLAADHYKKYMLDLTDPEGQIEAERRYKEMIAHPQLAEAFKKAGYGSGNWRAEAQHMYDDAMARAAGKPSLGKFVSAEPGAVPAGAAPAAPQAAPQTAGMSPEDRSALIRMVAAEARGEPTEGWRWVAGVMMNRAKQAGMTPAQVVLARGQFEGSKDPIFSSLKETDPLFQRIAEEIDPLLQGKIPNPTDADHYFAPKTQAALGRPVPPWAQGQTPVGTVGGHQFYKLGYRGQPQQGPAAGPPAPGGFAGAVQRAQAEAPNPAVGDYVAALRGGRAVEAGQQPPGQMSPEQMAERLLREDQETLDLAQRYRQPEAITKALREKVEQATKTGQYYVPGYGMALLPGVAQAKSDEKFATDEAPKRYSEVGETLRAAQSRIGVLKIVSQIAPYAATGFQAGVVPASIAHSARQMAASFGLVKPDADPTVAMTELFKYMTERGVFEMTKELKPATQMDLLASRAATLSINTDPSAIPVVMPVLMRLEQKAARKAELQQAILAQGRRPNEAAIEAQVDKEFPLDDLFKAARESEGQGGGQGGAPAGDPGAPRAPGAPGVQQASAPAPAMTREQVMRMPDGPITEGPFKGMIKQGTQLHMPSGSAGTASNPLPDQGWLPWWQKALGANRPPQEARPAHEAVGRALEPAPVKEGQFFYRNGVLFQRRGGRDVEVAPPQDTLVQGPNFRPVVQ